MVAGLLGNESSDSNRFTLVTPKSENNVRLQATLGNQNPTGLPVGVVSMPNLNYCDKKEDSLNDQNRTDDIINDTLNVQKGADDIINDTINIQKGAGDIINDQDGTNHKINTQDGTDNIINHQSDVKDEIELTMEEIKILEIMKNKPDITIKQLTVILSGISNRTITRNIVILKKKGLLERVGSRKKGYWEVKR
ncbi:HTH domain-containing protein [Catenibacterium sp. NSJ-22]|uniref:HTH domain-containing protein n=2 Tax=Coprobacillaceae TaxID=2810280 RepID=A0ABR7KB22_9FIRM|nr:HTH domain-containing protein [Catenibacterium faecis]